MKKVLIVEDDYVLHLINKKYIELLGHKVIASATNSEEAIMAVKNFNPDVIIMDLRLEHGLDGIDTMKEIAKFSDVPVIYLSGDANIENKIRAEETNMLAFFMKPVLFEQLRELFSTLE